MHVSYFDETLLENRKTTTLDQLRQCTVGVRACAIRLSNNLSVCALSRQSFCCEGVWGRLTLRANQSNEMPCCSVEMITSRGQALDWWGQYLPLSLKYTSTSTTTTTTSTTTTTTTRPFRQRQVTPSQPKWPTTLPWRDTKEGVLLPQL